MDEPDYKLRQKNAKQCFLSHLSQPLNMFLGESPRTEEPGGVQCMGSQKVRHD